MAGDMRVARLGGELVVGDYLFVGSAERSFPIILIVAGLPGQWLVTVETSASTTWTLPVAADEPCAVEVMS